MLSDERRQRKYAQHKAYRDDLKKKAIEGYGGRCQVCGIDDIDVLAIDHVNGGGTKEREVIKPSQVHRYIVYSGFPKSYRVLCFNCNFKSHLSVIRTGKPLESKYGL